MNHFIKIMLAPILGLILLSLSGCRFEPAEDRVHVLKLTTVLPQDHPSSKALAYFEEQLELHSKGEIDLKVFYNGQLGSAVETVELCRGGNIEIINCSSAYLAQFLSLFKVLELPFIFRDSQHQYEVLNGETGKTLVSEALSIELVLLAFFDAGSRNVMTKAKPVVTPADLAGLKIRVMPSPLLLKSINTIGASAIPMNQGEVYSALQMGVLDGWENNPPTALNFRMYETGCIYYSHTNHSSIPDLLLMSNRSLKRLPEHLQKIIHKVAADTQIQQRKLWAVAETESIEKLKSEGMIFSQVDQQLFKAKVSPVYESMFQRYGERFEKLCTEIRGTKQ